MLLDLANDPSTGSPQTRQRPGAARNRGDDTMAKITIQDLEVDRELDRQALSRVTGGWFWLYQPVTSYFYNPFVYTMQSSWASRGMMMDTQHNNFMNFLRS
jgi:hypothetical protein